MRPIDQVISFLMRFVKYGQINKDNTSDKLKPKAQKPFRDFNSRSGCTKAKHFFRYVAKQPSLML